jgi:hypothetical protein
LPHDPPASRLVAAYDPAFRTGMGVAAAGADEPATMAAAVERLPAPDRELLDLLLLVAPAGDPLPDRLRDRIARHSGALWAEAILLPRATAWQEGHLHPQHYAGSCRLNPAVAAVDFSHPRARGPDAPAAFPPADARWDAIVFAAALESSPAALTVDGTIRRDVERRLYTQLGGDEPRWALALRYARAVGLVRTHDQRLVGQPEARMRPLADVSSLLQGGLGSAAAALVLRLADGAWTSVAWLESLLAGPGREAFYSPRGKLYPNRPERFDDAGWREVEWPEVVRALDVLHRVGAIDALRDHEAVTAFRAVQPRPPPIGGFLLTPAGEVLCHVAELRLEPYGRLARMAPFVQGDALRRHQLSRDGVAAELGAGHRDTLEFLREHSRTGVSPNIVDQLREWQRSASRLTVLTGVDIVEEGGRFRVALPGDTGRVVDYAQRPRARFIAIEDRLLVPDGWDPLDVRALLDRVARPLGRDGDAWVWRAERRPHADPGALLARLRGYHGGDLPAELELLVLAGAALPPVVAADAVLLTLPDVATGPLRRDRVAGPLLRRVLPTGEIVVARSDVPTLMARVAALGLAWTGAVSA